MFLKSYKNIFCIIFNMPKTVEKYENERKKLLEKMFSILGVNSENNKFYLHELDSNEKKQQEILDLEPEIKKYFICGRWSCFKNPNMKREALSFVKHVVKDMGYELYAVRRLLKHDNGTQYRDTIYNIAKNI